MLKKIKLIFFCSVMSLHLQAQLNVNDYPIAPVNIQDIHLTDNFWLPKIKTIQNTTIQFGFDKCKEEGRFNNFLIAGGKMQGKIKGFPFDDTDVYKIIEGASNTLITSPNKKLDAYLDSIITIISIGQESDGYITTWHTVDPDHPPVDWVKPGPRWVNEISSHELYNAGHLYEAAAVHYLATGKKNMLNIALKNADLLVKIFGPEPGKIHAPSGHEIVETGLVKLYRITKNEDYLKLAKYLLDVRGDSSTHTLYGPYNQDHTPVTKQDEAVGHAVRAVYMYAGMTDIAALYKDYDYYKATKMLWENVVNKKLYITGGVGARHEGEAFGDNYELPNLTAYSETCAAIGDIYWNHRMFMLSGEAKYFDIIERTLYNGLLSGISLDGKNFFYPNPLESDAKFTFNRGAVTRSPWFDCSCCPTNMIRFLPSMPGLIYAVEKDTLFVNLYASNKAAVSLNKQRIDVSQQTEYPWNGNITVQIDPETSTVFTVKLRVPGWARNEVVPGSLYTYLDKNNKKISLVVNGKPMTYVIKNGYINIARKWNKGDKVQLALPMEVRKVKANDNVKDDQGLVSLEYGPLVYCVEGVDNPEVNSLVISDKAVLKSEKENGFLGGVNTITGQVSAIENGVTKKAELKAIPYYAWANRGVTNMKVWVKRAE
ncbi:MAG TPA: beta-L-arabinofuranosidase domain-containing protein [Cyclobacteriaceae bacterium]